MTKEQINLTPLNQLSPTKIDIEQYNKLTAKKRGGWSTCSSETEFLAKLHYLETGLLNNKITLEEFNKREELLVVQWWLKAL